MIHTIYRVFFDYEKEERWINQMSNMGMNLVSSSPFVYTFQEGEQGKYTYRIELLDSLGHCYDSIVRMKQYEKEGIECIVTRGRWAYLRKKKADGPFDLHSDYFARIHHYGKIATMYGILAGVNCMNGMIQYLAYLDRGFGASLVISLICLGVCLLLTPVFIATLVRRNRLKWEQQKE